jgi:hypothetical protein
MISRSLCSIYWITKNVITVTTNPALRLLPLQRRKKRTKTNKHVLIIIVARDMFYFVCCYISVGIVYNVIIIKI